ncbi:hypothetical protein [Halomarina litorea]|uniref:hypothetical protein n=1 Tax=Halomarina litorea TaxID=2961595 RepID=UPI0020C39503|nr:hypothetical protein [Halomarina sp. BCD28]
METDITDETPADDSLVRGRDGQFRFERAVRVDPAETDDVTGHVADRLADGTLVRIDSGRYRADSALEYVAEGHTVGIEVVGDGPATWVCHDDTDLVASQLGRFGAGWSPLAGLYVDGPIELVSEGDANCPGFAIMHFEHAEVTGVRVADEATRETLYFRHDNHAPASHDQPSYFEDLSVAGMSTPTTGRNSAFGFFSEGMEGPTVLRDVDVENAGGHGAYLSNSSRIHVDGLRARNCASTNLRLPTRSYVRNVDVVLDGDYRHQRDAVGIAAIENEAAFEGGDPIGMQVVENATIEHCCHANGVRYSLKLGHDKDGMDAGDVDFVDLTVEHERTDAPAVWVGTNFSGTARFDDACTINGKRVREHVEEGTGQVRVPEGATLEFVETIADPVVADPFADGRFAAARDDENGTTGTSASESQSRQSAPGQSTATGLPHGTWTVGGLTVVLDETGLRISRSGPDD